MCDLTEVLECWGWRSVGRLSAWVQSTTGVDRLVMGHWSPLRVIDVNGA